MPVNQPVVTVFAAVFGLVLVVFGLLAVRSKSTTFAAACEGLAHGGFAFGGLLFLYFVVPRFKQLFEDFGTELPVMTRLLIGVSDLTINYWYLFVLLIPAATALDVVAFAAFHRNPDNRYVARIFSGAVSLFLLGHGAFCIFALLAGNARLLQIVQ